MSYIEFNGFAIANVAIVSLTSWGPSTMDVDFNYPLIMYFNFSRLKLRANSGYL